MSQLLDGDIADRQWRQVAIEKGYAFAVEEHVGRLVLSNSK